jgi:hypothetical protein
MYEHDCELCGMHFTTPNAYQRHLCMPLSRMLEMEIAEHRRQNEYADKNSVNYNANSCYIDAYSLVLAQLRGDMTWWRARRASQETK